MRPVSNTSDTSRGCCCGSDAGLMRRLKAVCPAKTGHKHSANVIPRWNPHGGKAMDWQRHEKNIRAKVEYWFEIIVKQLSERGVSQRNVYNMDETGVMLSDLDTVKVLIARGGKEQRRGRALKRTITTAIECVSVGGRVLPPLIIFPGTVLVQQAHGCLMRHPVCTIAAVRRAITIPHSANGRPLVLIMDGFGSHESLDVVTFCFENNIILCRQPSQATDKLQPCDIGVFSPLKIACRDQVDQLYRNGAATVNKAHFTLLHSRAREIATTSRNI